MKITHKPGNRWSKDKKYFIETKGAELFSMHRLFLLINQLTINEWGRNKEKGYVESKFPFFFENAINEIIELGKDGINLLKEENNKISEQLCKKYDLKYSLWIQTKLNEFAKENGNTENKDQE